MEIVSLLLKSGADDSFTLSPPKPVTYSELVSSVNKIISALIDIGFTDPSSALSSRARVSIYADTSLRWQLMAQTFSRLGHVITTAYTTLGEEGLLRSLVEPDVEFVFCGEDQVGMVAKVVERAEKVKWVVYDADEARVDKACLFHPFILASSRFSPLWKRSERLSKGVVDDSCVSRNSSRLVRTNLPDRRIWVPSLPRMISTPSCILLDLPVIPKVYY